VKLSLRPAREDAAELEVVAALDRECSPVLRTAQRCRQLLQQGGQLDVAAAGQTVLGFAAFSRVLDEATLLNIVVAPERRQRGIAERLLRHSCHRLRQCGARSLFLEVRAGNSAAIALYRGLGCRDVGLRRNYYAARDGLPREDARLMTLDLETADAGTGN
jgi:ribosomal-protein-alanine N-acetyltransferase